MKLYRELVKWTDARKRCLQDRADLATPEDSAVMGDIGDLYDGENGMIHITHICRGGVNLSSLVGGSGARCCVILVLREFIFNTPAISFILPAFDDTGSLGPPPRRVVYLHGSTLDHCFPFPCGE